MLDILKELLKNLNLKKIPQKKVIQNMTFVLARLRMNDTQRVINDGSMEHNYVLPTMR